MKILVYLFFIFFSQIFSFAMLYLRCIENVAKLNSPLFFFFQRNNVVKLNSPQFFFFQRFNLPLLAFVGQVDFLCEMHLEHLSAQLSSRVFLAQFSPRKMCFKAFFMLSNPSSTCFNRWANKPKGQKTENRITIPTCRKLIL